MKSILFLILATSSSNAFGASPVKFKIAQVIKNQHIIVAQGKDDGTAQIGQTFLVNFPDDQQCSVILKNIQDQQFTFKTSSCDREADLKKNLEIEAAMVNVDSSGPVERRSQEENTPTQKYTPPNIRFGLSAHYNNANSIEFNDTIGNDVAFNTNGALGFGLRGGFLEENSWGVLASFEYEAKRTIDSISGAGSTTFFTNKADVSFFLLEGTLAYRWGFFYLPFGFNYSIPILNNSGDEKLEGTLGGVLGAGFVVNDNVSLEILVRAVGMRFEDKAVDDILNSGFLSGLVFRGTVWF
jgi:hypothetical protein